MRRQRLPVLGVLPMHEVERHGGLAQLEPELKPEIAPELKPEIAPQLARRARARRARRPSDEVLLAHRVGDGAHSLRIVLAELQPPVCHSAFTFGWG